MRIVSAETLSRIVEEELLPRVEKPSRYLGCEVNAVRKDPSSVHLRLALAFPDLYDLGLPNLGILVLYEALNRQPGIAAERVYAPGLDLEALLRERGLPLFSLETRSPLGDFDCVGFTLQYELCYTNILNMLDMAGIPLLARDRSDDHPIIIAGGPCVFNPEPLADFVDAFAIGDGEEVIIEIAQALMETKGHPRRERCERLARIEGVYVPALYDVRALEDGTVIPEGPTVRKRVVGDLDRAPFPAAPIVPYTQQVHDRMSLEVLRGCTQGCRFCQAGMTTRPVRERSLGTLRTLEEQALRSTGYEELALSSLSTCDHSQVKALVQQSVETATPWGAGVSLPSLRLDSFSVDLSAMVQNVRKSGLTFAPEAATPRMRAVINKWIGDDELVEMTGEVFRRGWETVKLYFMIGLPTELDSDVVAIADLSRRVLANGRRHQPRAKVNLGVSTFVPKAHTPFQWERQISVEETLAKQRLLNAHLRSGLKFGRHDAFASFLEGVFSRGDRRVGAALLEAWRRGARMDAWSEHLDVQRWLDAFAAAGLDPAHYLRARNPDDPLPWDHIDILVTREFLRREYERSRRWEVAIDCRRGKCHQCGVIQRVKPLCAAMLKRSRAGARLERDWRLPELPPRPALNPVQRIRFRFVKEGSLRFLSHLEMLNAWTRALRRAQAPLAYSQGFHPQPKIAFGTALAVGLESEGEYADVVLNERVDPEAFVERLNLTLPAGLRVLCAAEVPLASPSLTSEITAARYRVEVPHATANGSVCARVTEFLRRTEFPVVRQGKKGPRVVDVRALVWGLNARDGGRVAQLEMVLAEGEGGRVRPQEVAAAILGLLDEAIPLLRVRKLESYVRNGEGLRPAL